MSDPEENFDPSWTHFDSHGRARMVDVGAKRVSERMAVAEALIVMAAETWVAIQQRQMHKGDVLQVARIAGIMAAKRTDQLIPLCHGLPLTSAAIDFQFLPPNQLRLESTVRTQSRTGVEMEALVAVTTAGLTIYDMCKAVDRSMEIQTVRLLEKRGGRSGHWQRSMDLPQSPDC